MPDSSRFLAGQWLERAIWFSVLLAVAFCLVVRSSAFAQATHRSGLVDGRRSWTDKAYENRKDARALRDKVYEMMLAQKAGSASDEETDELWRKWKQQDREEKLEQGGYYQQLFNCNFAFLADIASAQSAATNYARLCLVNSENLEDMHEFLPQTAKRLVDASTKGATGIVSQQVSIVSSIGDGKARLVVTPINTESVDSENDQPSERPFELVVDVHNGKGHVDIMLAPMNWRFDVLLANGQPAPVELSVLPKTVSLAPSSTHSNENTTPSPERPIPSDPPPPPIVEPADRGTPVEAGPPSPPGSAAPRGSNEGG